MALLELKHSHFNEGYSATVRTPSFVFIVGLSEARFDATHAMTDQWLSVRAMFERALPNTIHWRPLSADTGAAMLLHLEDVFYALGHPNITAGTYQPIGDHEAGSVWRLTLPIFNYAGKQHLLHRGTRDYLLLLSLCLEGQVVDKSELHKLARNVVSALKRCVPSSLSRREILCAVVRNNIPWRQISPALYQVGWGKYSRFIDSTHTDATPVVSSTLAKNKLDTKVFLNALGFPVARGQAVSSLDAAKAVAQQIGYPVVVKPNAQDGGKSVFVGLAEEADLAHAFEQIPRNYFPLLVEQYVDGVDYRLTLWQNTVQFVVERMPARVCGDGMHTVQQLIDLTNKTRRDQRWYELNLNQSLGVHPINPNDDTGRWLRYQGLTLHSVPASGRIVRLKGAASISQGGTRRSVPSSEIHPDNIRLAIDVAEALRLDIAGIDMLIPDISRSWQESGAYICEVNSQPQLFQGFDALVHDFVSDFGRIPVTLIVTDPLPLEEQHSLAKSIAVHSPNTALVSDGGMFLYGQVVAPAHTDKRILALRALSNRRAEQLVYILSPSELNMPVPFDSVDLLIVDDTTLSQDAANVVLKRLAWLRNANSQVVVLSDAHPDDYPKWRKYGDLIASRPVTRAQHDMPTSESF